MTRNGRQYFVLDGHPFDPLQVFSAAQNLEFFSVWNDQCVPLAIRAETVSFGDRRATAVDVILFNPVERLTAILLGWLLTADHRLALPSAVEQVPEPILDTIVGFILGQIQIRDPAGEVLGYSLESMPYQPGAGRMRVAAVDNPPYRIHAPVRQVERVLPGASRYPDVVNHLKRYLFASSAVGGRRILDCACGTGYGAALLLHDQAVASYVGVDIDAEAISFCRTLVKDGRSRFECRSLEDLNENGFDLVVSFETIEHVEDPHAFLAELVKRLSADGKLVLSVPCQYWHGSHLNPFHVTNWNSERVLRMARHFFRDITVCTQRLSLLGPDTVAASGIRCGNRNPAEDEVFVAVLGAPSRRRPKRIVIHGINRAPAEIQASVASARMQRQHDDIVLVTNNVQPFLNDRNIDILSTPGFKPAPGDEIGTDEN